MNIAKMMKDLHKLQSEMKEKVETLEVTGTAGGGAVRATLNGKKELISLEIAKDAVDGDDLGLLQDLVIAAVNDAGRKVEEQLQSMTQGLTGGLDIPGLS